MGVRVPQAGDEKGPTRIQHLRPGRSEAPPHLDDAASRHAHVARLTRAGRRIQGARARTVTAQRAQLGAGAEGDDARVPDQQVRGW